jgi:CheY-like chemotaxis protein
VSETNDSLPVGGNNALSMRILLAEDDPTNQKVASIWLSRGGHKVKIAADGQACVDLYRAGSFDAILMDIAMPIMGGVEATSEIRRFETANHLPRIPIIAVTAIAMQGDRERFLESGMDEYISKPYRLAQLGSLLSKVRAAAA